jgi:hypothetical protein
MNKPPYKIIAWRDGSDTRLPMAFPSEPAARAMFTHILRADSDYDHAKLCEVAAGGYTTVIEIGHRVGTVAAGLVADTINRAMIAVVDQCYTDMMTANGTEPYSHEEYDRCDQVLTAALVMLTNGDMPYARALRWAFTDSGENAHYYLTCENRNAFCYNAGQMTREEYEATLRWAVECEEHGETWTDAFETREQAQEHADSLVANTTVVDREAANAS